MPCSCFGFVVKPVPLRPKASQIGCRPEGPDPQRPRNHIPLKTINLYIPDDNFDQSVPKVFALGRHMVQTAGGNEERVLSGYFSALCAVLPRGLGIAKRILECLSYRVREVKIPSQASEWNISLPASSDQHENINFALLCILPFQNKPKKAEAKIIRRVTAKCVYNFPSYDFCQESDMETLRVALSLSRSTPHLRRFIAASVRVLATMNTPLGFIVSQVTDLCGD